MALIKVCGTDVLVSICKYTQKTPFDLYAFKEDKHFKDLTILCKDGKVLAHKFVLAQHSEFLRKHFSQNETAETIFCPEFNAGSMRKVLDLLYSGQAVTKGNGELDEVNEIKKSFRLMFELKVGRQPRPIIYDVDDDEVEPSEDPADRSNNPQAQEGSENTIQETELHGHVQRSPVVKLAFPKMIVTANQMKLSKQGRKRWIDRLTLYLHQVFLWSYDVTRKNINPREVRSFETLNLKYFIETMCLFNWG